MALSRPKCYGTPRPSKRELTVYGTSRPRGVKKNAKTKTKIKTKLKTKTEMKNKNKSENENENEKQKQKRT